MTSGQKDLFIRNVRADDVLKQYSCVTLNSLTGVRKTSESTSLSIKGNVDESNYFYILCRKLKLET